MTRTARALKEAIDLLNSNGIALLNYDKGVDGEGPLITFKCSCGKEAQRHLFQLRKRGVYCKTCVAERCAAARRTPLKVIQEFLEPYGATLIKIYPGDKETRKTHIVYSCKCGAVVDRIWDSLCNPLCRTVPKCRECSYDERKLPKGEDHYLWDATLLDSDRNRRWNSADKRWASEILARDNYTCQITLTRGGSLTTHHIYSRTKVPDLKLLLSNGITLSKDIHMEYHTSFLKNTRIPGTPESFKEFSFVRYGRQIELPEDLYAMYDLLWVRA